jgi:hypothetical protein
MCAPAPSEIEVGLLADGVMESLGHGGVIERER